MSNHTSNKTEAQLVDDLNIAWGELQDKRRQVISSTEDNHLKYIDFSTLQRIRQQLDGFYFALHVYFEADFRLNDLRSKPDQT